MPRRRTPPSVVERTPAGYVVYLGAQESQLVLGLLDELRGLLQSEDPSYESLKRRLFPPAYHLPEHTEHDAEYQRFMREELVKSRLPAIDGVQAALTDQQPMDDSALLGFMQALNGVRLVLGTLLDVGEDHDPDDIDDDHPMLAEHQLYMFLSWLLDHAVSASMGE